MASSVAAAHKQIACSAAAAAAAPGPRSSCGAQEAAL